MAGRPRVSELAKAIAASPEDLNVLAPIPPRDLLGIQSGSRDGLTALRQISVTRSALNSVVTGLIAENSGASRARMRPPALSTALSEPEEVLPAVRDTVDRRMTSALEQTVVSLSSGEGAHRRFAPVWRRLELFSLWDAALRGDTDDAPLADQDVPTKLSESVALEVLAGAAQTFGTHATALLIRTAQGSVAGEFEQAPSTIASKSDGMLRRAAAVHLERIADIEMRLFEDGPGVLQYRADVVAFTGDRLEFAGSLPVIGRVAGKDTQLDLFKCPALSNPFGGHDLITGAYHSVGPLYGPAVLDALGSEMSGSWRSPRVEHCPVLH